MPLTAKGKKIRKQMYKTYKTKAGVDRVFYAMIKEGKIKGAESKKKKGR